MKRVLFLFVFLSFVGGVAGGADAKRSISGVVKCDNGNSSLAQCAGATVVCEKTSAIGVVADFEGKFGLSCPNDEGILVEFVGMDGVKISAAELDKKSTGLSIELKSSATAIEEVVVKGCTVNKEKGIKSATDIDGKCYPTECISPRWELIGKNKNARCKEQKCNTGWEQGEDGTWSCETIKKEENKKTEENSQGYSDAEIKELQEKADDAKANEQLLANRMLGGATMAATGAGGQMLATGLAEKKADADAERQMTAYLQ
ncbi:MAG: hypothetical protein E7006_02785, partial [Alphaproteobacteria bacterium]|nr:hypothetical protein [Alphaproteobacteria bacterium]